MCISWPRGKKEINSHWSKIYGVLSVLIFSSSYLNIVSITQPQSNRKSNKFCDNQEVVTKLNTISANRKIYSTNNKTKDLDAILQIQYYLPTQFEATHGRSHQDLRKSKDKLTLIERLNIKIDRLIGSKASTPKATNIRGTTLVVYVDKAYIPNNYVKVTRTHCGTKKASSFIQDKYWWNKTALDVIKWELQSKKIQRHSYSQRNTILKFVHR